MSYVFLCLGIISFILSFLIHKFFIQFIVLAVIMLGFFLVDKNSRSLESFKKVLEEHNKLLRDEENEIL